MTRRLCIREGDHVLEVGPTRGRACVYIHAHIDGIIESGSTTEINAAQARRLAAHLIALADAAEAAPPASEPATMATEETT